MKNFIWIAAHVWLLSSPLFAQLTPQYAPCGQCNANPPVYGAPQDFLTNSIVSDYGMRIAARGTRFHQGIDFGDPASDGDAVVSLTAGRVTRISESNSNSPTAANHLKKIVIDGNFRDTDINTPTNPNGHIFSYLHLFDDNPASNVLRSGGFVIMPVSNLNPNLLTIINLQTQVALCEIAGIVFTYNGHQYTTENYVQAGQLIALKEAIDIYDSDAGNYSLATRCC